MVNKGYKQTEEHRRKIGIANAIRLKGKICSKEGLRKIIKMHKEKRKKYGYINSPDTRKKLSETWKKKWVNGEVTANDVLIADTVTLSFNAVASFV